VAAIAAANEIVDKPYRYGGGHRSFVDTGYDCSGSVSHALGGAGLLKSPLDSRSFARWGARGRGTWITVYTNPSHAYIVIAGLRFDTSGSEAEVVRRGGRPGTGPRWRTRRSPVGYVARHPPGL
jgi:cell wall-associated NlpC family hydrolase